MINDKIIAAINKSLSEINGIPTINPENKTYKPTQRVSWCRTTHLPAEPTQTTIGFDRQIRWGGLYQIDLFFPSNTGAIQPIADAVVAHFNTNRFIPLDDTNPEEVLTIRMAWRGTSAVETDWYRVPVLLRYEAFTQ